MGNQNKNLQQGFVEDSRLGLIRIERENIAGESQLKNEVIVIQTNQTKNSYDEWLKKIGQLEEVEELLFLPLKNTIQTKGFCGTNGIVESKFPSYRLILRQQIINRSRIEKHYEEEELWYFLYSLLVIGQHFERMKEKIGNVHPNNILMNEKGFVKMIGSLCLPFESDNFCRVCESQLSDVFLAPEEIDYDCIDRYCYPCVDGNRAQLFSIGMTMLQIGSLQSSSYVYDRGPYRINRSKLNGNLELLKMRYGIKICSIIQNWLEQKAVRRRSCKEVYEELVPYEDKIMNLQPFSYEYKFREMKIDSSNDSFSEKAMNSFINGRHMEETQIISNSNHYTQVYYPLQHSVKPNIHTVQHHHNKDILNEIEREKVASEASLSRFYNYSATNVVRKNNNY